MVMNLFLSSYIVLLTMSIHLKVFLLRAVCLNKLRYIFKRTYLKIHMYNIKYSFCFLIIIITLNIMYRRLYIA